MQSSLNEPDAGSSPWPEISPLLDSAMAGLRDRDYSVIVLRFFERKDLRQVGAALGITENAAQKRVNYALEKMRRIFAKHGVKSTTGLIAAMMLTHSVQAAPGALAKSATTVAIAKGATATGSTLTITKGALKIMGWTKLKIAAVAGATVLLATAGATGVYVASANVVLQKHSPYVILGHPGVDYLPAATWTNSGFRTPEATVKTILWAESRGDAKTILDAASPAFAQKFEDATKNETQQELSAGLIGLVDHVDAIRVRHRTVLSDNRVSLELYSDLDHESGAFYFAEIYTNLDGQWKLSSCVLHSGSHVFPLPE